jgi:hypothetical protein
MGPSLSGAGVAGSLKEARSHQQRGEIQRCEAQRAMDSLERRLRLASRALHGGDPEPQGGVRSFLPRGFEKQLNSPVEVRGTCSAVSFGQ